MNKIFLSYVDNINYLKQFSNLFFLFFLWFVIDGIIKWEISTRPNKKYFNGLILGIQYAQCLDEISSIVEKKCYFCMWNVFWWLLKGSAQLVHTNVHFLWNTCHLEDKSLQFTGHFWRSWPLEDEFLFYRTWYSMVTNKPIQTKIGNLHKKFYLYHPR